MEHKYEFKLLGASVHHGREIYVVETSGKKSEIKLTMTYYKSSGQCEKDGKLWGGEVFPIIGVADCVETPNMSSIRALLWGKNYKKYVNDGWICKSPAWGDESGRNFWTRDLHETSKWLKSQSLNATHIDAYDLISEFKDELDVGFGLILKPITEVVELIKSTK